jgi:hypothetical protein
MDSFARHNINLCRRLVQKGDVVGKKRKAMTSTELSHGRRLPRITISQEKDRVSVPGFTRCVEAQAPPQMTQ